MLNLLKADLLRIVKDKLFLILIIIACAMSVFMPLLYLGIGYLLIDDGMTVRELFSSSTLALTAFSPFSNFGLIVAIFMCIIITKDFGNGTVRNKLIMGKTRLEVYLSNTISSIIAIVGIMIGFVVLNFLVSSIFFHIGIDKNTIGFILQSLIYNILGWVVLSLAINFFSHIMKNAGLSIIVYVIIGLVLVFVGSITSTVVDFLEPGTAVNVIEVFNAINIPSAMTTELSDMTSIILGDLLGESSKFETSFIIEYISSVLVFGSFFGFVGFVIFRKKDLK